MSKRKVRSQEVAALIVVGEGPHDEAFINHMKELYDSRESGQKVKVESADGGSPRDIINYVVKKKHIAYDTKIILMDSDISLTDQNRKTAQKNGIIIVQSTPLCLEGMLLDVLGQKIPDSSQACKNKLHPKLSGPPTAKSSYGILFPKAVLDATPKAQIVDLKKYISNSN